MAIETGKNDESVPQDTTAYAIPWGVGEYSKRGGPDRLLVPGLGVCLSRSAVDDMERDAMKLAEQHGDKSYNPYYQIVISEERLRQWVETLDKHSNMQAEEAKSQAHDHERFCYPGTDTQDPTKQDSKYRVNRHRNNYDLDKSESTIRIGVRSGDRHLNGSMVRHQHYIGMEFTTPDGRVYGDISMTFDQFAAALVSNTSTPCTWDDYWGIEQNSIRLKEVVHPPQSIDERMVERLQNRFADIDARFDALKAKLDEKIESGKAMSKTSLVELNRELNLLRSALSANRDFTIEQSREEVTSIVEQAAISVAHNHNLSAEEVVSNSHVGALLETIIKRKHLLESRTVDNQDSESK